MTVLGAIIGGGKSRRFGSDKAAALVDGVPLIDHVHAALRPQTADIVICGREWRAWTSLPDMPQPDLGPLGGLNAALAHAKAHGFDAVLTVPVDTMPLPADLCARLDPGPSFIADQWLIGLWPVTLASALNRHIKAGHRSVRSWIDASGARAVDGNGLGLRNVNRKSDLR
ncbi:molybdenum cofactor guanylyltransferase [Croceicoccus sp. Ery15]|uniref:molybdenum cofactor guanylyltransferase n=1 Tax=Croceicoccus sp. Ery15 TaxID=1703338 RepID=UPI001E48908B|nr:molybdenum cofactor guanylyltransferase [Croceicoccus sp. Ery15]